MRRGRQAEKLCGTVSESLLIHGPRGIISINENIMGQIPIAMAKEIHPLSNNHILFKGTLRI